MWVIVYVGPGGGGGVKGAPPQWEGTMPWLGRRRVAGEVPCSLRFGVFPPEGEI